MFVFSHPRAPFWSLHMQSKLHLDFLSPSTPLEFMHSLNSMNIDVIEGEFLTDSVCAPHWGWI